MFARVAIHVKDFSTETQTGNEPGLHRLTVRMPSKNAYPCGYFRVQAQPTGTANYGGYHNLYMGNTVYPGLY